MHTKQDQRQCPDERRPYSRRRERIVPVAGASASHAFSKVYPSIRERTKWFRLPILGGSARE